MMKGGGVGVGGGQLDPEAQRKLKEAQEEMERNQKYLDEMSKSWEQKLQEAKAREDEEIKKQQEEEEARNSGRP